MVWIIETNTPGIKMNAFIEEVIARSSKYFFVLFDPYHAEFIPESKTFIHISNIKIVQVAKITDFKCSGPLRREGNGIRDIYLIIIFRVFIL